MQPVRGCGTRVKGGIYAECKLSPFGMPIEHFLIDPPNPIPDDLGLTPVGVKLFERDSVFHILDWVGSAHYKNVADFIEETRRFGASRRLSKSTDFSKLTANSRLIFVHERAIIQNFLPYHLDRQKLDVEDCTLIGYCPKRIAEHSDPSASQRPMCAGLWWEDVEDGMEVVGEGRAVVRKMPSFQYEAWRAPAAGQGDYTPGAFMSLPLTGLALIGNPDDREEEGRTWERIKSTTKLPVEVEED